MKYLKSVVGVALFFGMFAVFSSLGSVDRMQPEDWKVIKVTCWDNGVLVGIGNACWAGEENCLPNWCSVTEQ